MRISDWSSDVCSSDLARDQTGKASTQPAAGQGASSSAAVDMAQSAARRLQLDPKRDQNYQGRKLDFLNQKLNRDVSHPHPLQDPVSPFQVIAGTEIRNAHCQHPTTNALLECRLLHKNKKNIRNV